ncbi:MAG: flagellar assembly protein FliW [Brevinemataceae bacterium]
MEILKDSVIVFQKPIFGFEHLKEFYLIPVEEPEQFVLLQSKEDPEISFMLTQPKLFLSDYVLDIDDKDVEILDIQDHNDVIDFAIITIPESIQDMTMNILGPIVINTKNMYAVQSISNCAHYTTKCRLFAKQEENIAVVQ